MCQVFLADPVFNKKLLKPWFLHVPEITFFAFHFDFFVITWEMLERNKENVFTKAFK